MELGAIQTPAMAWRWLALLRHQSLPVGREVSLEVRTTDRYGCTVAEVIGEISPGLTMVEVDSAPS